MIHLNIREEIIDEESEKQKYLESKHTHKQNKVKTKM